MTPRASESISAPKSAIGTDELVAAIKSRVYGDNEILELTIPYSSGAILGLINDNARVISQEYTQDGVVIKADCPGWLAGKVLSTPGIAVSR